MSSPSPTSPFDTDDAIIYSLDRRGPNDPRFGSVHAVIAVLLVTLAAAAFVVL